LLGVFSGEYIDINCGAGVVTCGDKAKADKKKATR
jgi:hypothetical protein